MTLPPASSRSSSLSPLSDTPELPTPPAADAQQPGQPARQLRSGSRIDVDMSTYPATRRPRTGQRRTLGRAAPSAGSPSAGSPSAAGPQEFSRALEQRFGPGSAVRRAGTARRLSALQDLPGVEQSEGEEIGAGTLGVLADFAVERGADEPEGAYELAVVDRLGAVAQALPALVRRSDRSAAALRVAMAGLGLPLTPGSAAARRRDEMLRTVRPRDLHRLAQALQAQGVTGARASASSAAVDESVRERALLWAAEAALDGLIDLPDMDTDAPGALEAATRLLVPAPQGASGASGPDQRIDATAVAIRLALHSGDAESLRRGARLALALDALAETATAHSSERAIDNLLEPLAALRVAVADRAQADDLARLQLALLLRARSHHRIATDPHVLSFVGERAPSQRLRAIELALDSLPLLGGAADGGLQSGMRAIAEAAVESRTSLPSSDAAGHEEPPEAAITRHDDAIGRLVDAALTPGAPHEMADALRAAFTTGDPRIWVAGPAAALAPAPDPATLRLRQRWLEESIAAALNHGNHIHIERALRRALQPIERGGLDHAMRRELLTDLGTELAAGPQESHRHARKTLVQLLLPNDEAAGLPEWEADVRAILAGVRAHRPWLDAFVEDMNLQLGCCSTTLQARWRALRDSTLMPPPRIPPRTREGPWNPEDLASDDRGRMVAAVAAALSADTVRLSERALQDRMGLLVNRLPRDEAGGKRVLNAVARRFMDPGFAAQPGWHRLLRVWLEALQQRSSLPQRSSLSDSFLDEAWDAAPEGDDTGLNAVLRAQRTVEATFASGPVPSFELLDRSALLDEGAARGESHQLHEALATALHPGWLGRLSETQRAEMMDAVAGAVARVPSLRAECLDLLSRRMIRSMPVGEGAAWDGQMKSLLEALYLADVSLPDAFATKTHGLLAGQPQRLARFRSLHRAVLEEILVDDGG